MTATAIRVTIPGTNPRVLKEAGIERTPMPICVLIIRNAVPIHPTCASLVNFLSQCKPMRLIYIPIVWATLFDISKHWIGDCDILFQVKALSIAMFVCWNVVGLLDCWVFIFRSGVAQ
jgi:hypothetical protein